MRGTTLPVADPTGDDGRRRSDGRGRSARLDGLCQPLEAIEVHHRASLTSRSPSRSREDRTGWCGPILTRISGCRRGRPSARRASSWSVWTLKPVMPESAHAHPAFLDPLAPTRRARRRRRTRRGSRPIGLLLAAREEQLLHPFGDVGVAPLDHVLVVEVEVLVAHPAGVEGDAGLHSIEGTPSRRR